MAEKKATIRSVDKALQILELFFHNESLGLVEISSTLEMPKTTVFGLVATLERRGYLEQSKANGKYSLGLRLVELGAAAKQKSDIIQMAARLLRPITEINGHNAHITMLDRDSVVYMGNVESGNTISVKTNLGTRAPANCTSSGKAFLAYYSDEEIDLAYPEDELPALTPHSISQKKVLKERLAQIRDKGYALDCEESILGIKGVGVVVVSDSGKPILGISVAGIASMFTDEVVGEYVVQLKKVVHILEMYYS